MPTVALIPARGGSRGLPGKNLAEIEGRTLIRRAVDVARSVARIDDVCVSSDADDILAAATAAGAAPLRRPDDLATDTSAMQDVVLHFLDARPDADVVVLLPPTSPLRIPADIEACLDELGGATTVATVAPSAHPPEWLFRLGPDSTIEPMLGWDAFVLMRQDAQPAYSLNGAVYVARAAHLRTGGWFVERGTVGVVMPAERSVDIDDAFGLALARTLAEAAR